MAFDIGINFRGSSGYVSDGANETYCLADAYPTTRGGVTFGWEDAIDGGADRNSSLDRRLAGINYFTSALSTPRRFRVDLPASGSVEVHLAIGDPATGIGAAVDVVDGTTTLFTVPANGFNGSVWADATNADYSAANWPTSETGVSATMAGTTFRLSVTGSSGLATIAHLRIVQVGGGGGDVSVALTGQSATTSAGTLAVAHTQPLTGSAATASAGALVPTFALALSGSAATGSVGTLTPVLSLTLSGSEATVSGGTLTPTAAVGLSGAAATSAVGTLTPVLTVPLSGVSVAVSAGTLTAVSGTVADLTGLEVATAAGSVGVSVSVALSGISVTVSAGSLTAVGGDTVSSAPLCGTAGATALYTATAGCTPLYTATASAEVC